MTAQEKKQALASKIVWQIKSLKLSQSMIAYVHYFVKECSLHQLQNLDNNMLEFKKFMKQSLTTSWAK